MDSVNLNISRPNPVKALHLAALLESSIDTRGVVRAGGQAVRQAGVQGQRLGKDLFDHSVCENTASLQTRHSQQRYTNNLGFLYSVCVFLHSESDNMLQNYPRLLLCYLDIF